MRLRRFFTYHKKTFLFLGFLAIFATAVAYAAPRDNPYAPGETLDPTCAPTETNCYVAISSGGAQDLQSVTDNGNTSTHSISLTGGTFLTNIAVVANNGNQQSGLNADGRIALDNDIANGYGAELDPGHLTGSRTLFLPNSSGNFALAATDGSTVVTADVNGTIDISPLLTGGASSLALQTDGTPNGSQSLLNLVAGNNITLTDDGTGNVTIDSTGGGSGAPAGNNRAIQFNSEGDFGGDENQLAWDNSNKRLYIGAGISDSVWDDIGNPGQFNIFAPTSGSVSVDEFNQSFFPNDSDNPGLDDATYSGTYTGTDHNEEFYVYIDSTGTPDTFTWGDNENQTNNVPITGSSQLLENGISITFGSTTGHTNGDEWVYDRDYEPDGNSVINVASEDANNDIFSLQSNGDFFLGANNATVQGYQSQGELDISGDSEVNISTNNANVTLDESDFDLSTNNTEISSDNENGLINIYGALQPNDGILDMDGNLGDAGQVLSSNGDGTLSWIDAGGGCTPTLGSEQISNGTFDTDDTDWIPSGGWSYDSGNQAETASGTISNLDQEGGSLTEGATYSVSFDLSNYSNGQVAVRLGDANSGGEVYSADGSYTFTATYSDLSATGRKIRFLGTSGFSGTIDNISVKEQTCSSSSPSRFGVSGEDDTAGEDRLFNLGSNNFAISTTGYATPGEGFFGITNGLAWLGDDDGDVNGTEIQIDDPGQLIRLYANEIVTGPAAVLEFSNNNHSLHITTPSDLSSDYTLTLPNSAGNDGDVLTTDASGNLSWAAVSGGGGGAQDLQSVTDEGNTTTNKIIADGFESVSGDTIASILGPSIAANSTVFNMQNGSDYGHIDIQTSTVGINSQQNGNIAAMSFSDGAILITTDRTATDGLQRGLTGESDFSANIQSLDYVQKIYVDTAIAAISGSAQDLQSVTDQGNTTTNTISIIGAGTGLDVDDISTHAGIHIVGNNAGVPLLEFQNGIGNTLGLRASNISGGNILQLPNTGNTNSAIIAVGATDGTSTVYAGTDGIIDISSLLTGGGSAQDLQSVTDQGYITTNPIDAANFVAARNAGTDAIIFAANTLSGTAISISIDSSDEPFLQFNRAAGISNLYAANVTTSRTWQLPDASGTLALGATDGTNTVTTGTDGIINISSLLSSPQDLQSVTDEGNSTSNDIGSTGTISASILRAINYVQIGAPIPNINYATLNIDNITDTRTIELPDASGTLVLGATLNGTNFTADDTGNIDLGTLAPTLEDTLNNGHIFSQDNTILTTTHSLQIAGFPTGVATVSIQNAGSGDGAQISSSSGLGLDVSSSSGQALRANILPSSTNTVETIAKFERLSTGSGANGLGGSLDFQLTKSNGNGDLSNRIISKWTNATNTSQTSEFSITGVNNAVENTLFRIEGDGRTGINTAGTPNYSLDVGQASVTGIVASFTNSTGSCTINPTTSSVGCSSDETLKKNIISLDANDESLASISDEGGTGSDSSQSMSTAVLDQVLSLRPVSYNWKTESDTDPKHTGFIAQDVRQIFPDLVSEDPTTHLLSVNYMGFAPYIVRAVQEMDLQMKGINDINTTNNLRDVLVAWFGNTMNGIQTLFAKKVQTDELCVGTTCVTQDQFLQLIQNSHGTTVVVPPPSDSTSDSTSTDESSDDSDSTSDTTDTTGTTTDTTSNSSDTAPTDTTSDDTTDQPGDVPQQTSDQSSTPTDTSSETTSGTSDSSATDISSTPADSSNSSSTSQ